MGSIALQRGGGVGLGRFLAALTLAVFTLASAAQAQGRADYAPGNLQFALPDKWSVETTKQKLTLVAPNEDGFIQFTVLQPGNDAMLRAQSAQVLGTYLSDTVLADPGDSVTLNGMRSFRFNGTGLSDATNVQFVAVTLTPMAATPVLVLAYASQESFAAHAPVFEALIKSLRRR